MHFAQETRLVVANVEPVSDEQKLKTEVNVFLWKLRDIFDHPRSSVVHNFGRVCLSVCLSVKR